MNPVYLLLLPVLAGLLLLWVMRSDRRQQFVKQRLNTLTADKDDSEPDSLSLLRHVAPAIVQLPRKLAELLAVALEAAGNRIGLLHLLVAGLFSAIIVIALTSRVLALNPTLVMPLGLMAAAAGPVVLLRLAQARFRKKFLEVFP